MSAGDWKDLYQATIDGDFELVKYHIQNGINPNYQHPEILRTPLVTAILNNHTEVALYLLEMGADPKLESYFDALTPIKAAKKMKNKQLVGVIKKYL